MGGKKQSQRTKNNVRPSSSSRSAELLHNAVKVDSSFGALSPGSVLPALFPTLTSINIDQGLSPEYSICFKKFNKKDPVTKTKALQELTELIKNGNKDEAVAALPGWTHYYPTLTIDSNRRVREAAQMCHGALISACGRRSAPHLRRLLPVWLLAQHDNYAPASSLARTQLESTFPEGKLSEALSFCKTEIITQLIDNLTGNAEAMLSKKVEDQEERDIQVARIISSSLGALELFITKQPELHDDWLWEALIPLLHANSFWKLAAHTSDHVRTAWYGVVGCTIKRYASRVPQELGVKMARALIAQPERAATVAVQRWAAVLLLMDTVKEWHTWLDQKDLLIKRLLDVLENGGWGAAGLFSDMWLPLLAHLPTELLNKEFYMSFFNAILNGFDNKSLQNSMWIKNLAECLRYLSTQSHDYTTGVVTYVHRTWLEKIFTINDNLSRRNLIKHSATNMAGIAKIWLKQAKDSERYDQLIRNLWQNIGSTIAMQILNLSVESSIITQLIDDHILLLKTLNTAFNQEKKKLSIQFEDDKVDEKVDVKPTDNIICDQSLNERFKHNFNDLIEKVSCYYFDFAHKKEVSRAVFNSLVALLIDFDSENLFLAIARHFKFNSVFDLYDKVLKSWLAGDTMRCKELVDVVYLTVKYMTEDEQEKMFDSFQQFPPLVVEWCITLTLSHPHCSLPAGRRWMRGGVVEACVVGMCKRDRVKDTLFMGLSHDETGEVMLNESTVMKIIKIVCDDLDSEFERVESAIMLASQIVGALTGTALVKHTAPLLEKLFNLNLRVVNGSRELSISAWEEARSCWCDGLASLPPDVQRALQKSLSAEIFHFVFDYTQELYMQRIEHAASLCPYLFISCNNYKDQNADELAALTKDLFNHCSKQPRMRLEEFALRCEVIFGNINCPFEDENVFTKNIVKAEEICLDKNDFMYFAYNILYKAFFLRALMGKNESMADEVGADAVTWGNILIKDEYFQSELGELFYKFAVLHSVHQRYAFWEHFEIIRECTQRMQELLKDIVSTLSPEAQKILFGYVTPKGIIEGYYWAYASQHLTKIQESCDDRPNETLTNFVEIEETNQLKSDDGQSKDEEGSEIEGGNMKSHIQKQFEQSVMDWLDSNDIKEIVNGFGLFHTYQISYANSSALSVDLKHLVMARSVLAAHSDEPQVIEEVVQSIRGKDCGIDPFINAYYKHNHVMLYERDLITAPWAQIVSNSAIVDYLTAMVETGGWDMSASQWDFTTITLCSLTASLRASAHRWWNIKVSIMANSVLKLFTAVQQFIAKVRKEAEKRQPSAHVIALPTEWTDIFAPDLNKHLYELINIILRAGEASMTSCRVATIGSLVDAAASLQWDYIPAILRLEELSLKSLASTAMESLKAMVHHAYKYLAYSVLDSITKPLVLQDAENLAQWNSQAEDKEDDQRPEFTLEYYYEPLQHLQDLIEAALSNVKVCEGTCEMVPHSDSQRVALGYTLLASALLRHSALARKNLHLYYVEMFREYKYGTWLMPSAVRLLPAETLHCTSGVGTLSGDLLARFVSMPALNVYEWCDNVMISSLACSVLTETLAGAGGADARSWVTALDTRCGGVVERLVATAVTPVLLTRLLTQLRDRADELTNTKVSIQWSRAEIAFTLEVDERDVELTVQFADTHPLVPPRVVAAANSPCADTQWLVLYLAYQNGTLLNAAKMWIEAVTSKVEGSPQCFICYCRLHPIFGRLPSLVCHQCHNRFHSPCLRKWFSRSKKSHCPLCRSNF